MQKFVIVSLVISALLTACHKIPVPSHLPRLVNEPENPAYIIVDTTNLDGSRWQMKVCIHPVGDAIPENWDTHILYFRPIE